MNNGAINILIDNKKKAVVMTAFFLETLTISYWLLAIGY